MQRGENPNLLGSSYNAAFDRIEVFRVTARGTGGSDTAQAILQSTFGKIF